MISQEAFHIRPMTSFDLEYVLQIELSSPSPWTLSSLAVEVKRDNDVQLVISRDDLIIGWCCSRDDGFDAELLKIAVAENYRRMGLASELLTSLQARLLQKGLESIYLEVRSNNQAARKFYLTFGFFQVGLRRKYYSSPEDDAVLFKKDLQTDNG